MLGFGRGDLAKHVSLRCLLCQSSKEHTLHPFLFIITSTDYYTVLECSAMRLGIGPYPCAS